MRLLQQPPWLPPSEETLAALCTFTMLPFAEPFRSTVVTAQFSHETTVDRNGPEFFWQNMGCVCRESIQLEVINDYSNVNSYNNIWQALFAGSKTVWQLLIILFCFWPHKLTLAELKARLLIPMAQKLMVQQQSAPVGTARRLIPGMDFLLCYHKGGKPLKIHK